MGEYKFSLGYYAIKMLGKNLYSNPFAALSELIANGFDAGAKKVWVSLDVRDKKKSKISVIDDGSGMSDSDFKEKYLQVGQLNRGDQDFKMMGRKGIGKLAAFYLSNNYFVLTKTVNEENCCSLLILLEKYRNSEVTRNEIVEMIIGRSGILKID